MRLPFFIVRVVIDGAVARANSTSDDIRGVAPGVEARGRYRVFVRHALRCVTPLNDAAFVDVRGRWCATNDE